jgi:hypothetical protein
MTLRPARDRAAADSHPGWTRCLAYHPSRSGEGASRRFIEFFTAKIRNRNTRAANGAR